MVTDPDINIGHRHAPALRLLRETLEPHKGRLVGFGILMGLLGILPLLPVPWTAAPGLSAGELGHLGVLGTLIAVAFLISSVAAAYLKQTMAVIFERELRRSALRGLHEIPLSSLEKRPTESWIESLTNDLRTVERFFAKCLPEQIRQGALFFGAASLYIFIEGSQSALLLLCAVLIAALAVAVREKMSASREEFKRREAEIFQAYGESLQGARAIRAFEIEPFVERKFEERLTEAAMQRDRFLMALGRDFGRSGGTYFLAVAALTALSWHHDVSLEHALLHPLLLGLFYKAALFLVDAPRQWRSYLQQGARLAEVIYPETPRILQLAPRPTDGAKAASLEIHDLEISADGVYLGPFTFRLQRGELRGVVGPSHAGKSVLLEVIAGLRQAPVGKGRIMSAGGERLWQAGAGTLQLPSGFCALVEQKPYFFGGSLRENLVFANSRRLSDAVIWQAVEKCNLHHFLASVGGLDYPIGERGRNLTEGEKVRVALCRALLQDRPFLLLDEPFALLDEVSLGAVISILESLKDEKGIVVATQHLPEDLAPDAVLDFDRLPARDRPRLAGRPLLASFEIERHVGGQRMGVIDEV